MKPYEEIFIVRTCRNKKRIAEELKKKAIQNFVLSS